jgi:hypothetical protein
MCSAFDTRKILMSTILFCSSCKMASCTPSSTRCSCTSSLRTATPESRSARPPCAQKSSSVLPAPGKVSPHHYFCIWQEAQCHSLPANYIPMPCLGTCQYVLIAIFQGGFGREGTEDQGVDISRSEALWFSRGQRRDVRRARAQPRPLGDGSG